jgi:hypothetical protein
MTASGSSTASTDVYDAEIVAIRACGDNITFHAEQLKSRRPPRHDVNWNTTYRLQPANLLCIVLLATPGERLRTSQPIFWGEIIHDRNQRISPGNMRRQGKISIRLLSKSDSSMINYDDIPVRNRSCIAIIDCRVFVPEVISVLATFADPSFRSGLQGVSFGRYLLGDSVDDIMVEEGSIDNHPLDRLNDASPSEIVATAIRSSKLRAISKLPADVKETFILKVCSQPSVSTLDRTQAMALAKGFSYDLHCTHRRSMWGGLW